MGQISKPEKILGARNETTVYPRGLHVHIPFWCMTVSGESFVEPFERVLSDWFSTETKENDFDWSNSLKIPKYPPKFLQSSPAIEV